MWRSRSRARGRGRKREFGISEIENIIQILTDPPRPFSNIPVCCMSTQSPTKTPSRLSPVSAHSRHWILKTTLLK